MVPGYRNRFNGQHNIIIDPRGLRLEDGSVVAYSYLRNLSSPTCPESSLIATWDEIVYNPSEVILYPIEYEADFAGERTRIKDHPVYQFQQDRFNRWFKPYFNQVLERELPGYDFGGNDQGPEGAD